MSEARPERFPGYTIKRTLSKTAMSVVYLGEQDQLKRPSVIKVISDRLSGQRNFRERFLREARILAELNHPNIVTIYDMGETEEGPYITMEYVSGGDLSERIKKGLSDQEALTITRDMATALEFAHSKGYIHRDIKPGNVLFDESNRLLLTDFGIAKALDSEETQLTAIGAAVGTPTYMAPEQFDGGEIDGRADLYSLGIVLYRMLTGEAPYVGDNTAALLYKHKMAPIPELPPHLNQYQKLINGLLEKEPENRYQTASQVIEVINNFLLIDEETLTPLPDSTGAKSNLTVNDEKAQPHSISRLNLSIICIAATIALLYVGYTIVDPAETSTEKLELPTEQLETVSIKPTIKLAISRFSADDDDRFVADSMAMELFNRLHDFTNIELIPLVVSWTPQSDPTSISADYYLTARLKSQKRKKIAIVELRDKHENIVSNLQVDLEAPSLTKSTLDVARELTRVLHLRIDEIVWTEPTRDQSNLSGEISDNLALARALLFERKVLTDVNRALAIAEKTILSYPRLAEAHTIVCRANSALFEADRNPTAYEKAEKHCSRAMILAPHTAESTLALGNLYYLGGQYEEAETTLERAISLDGSLIDAHLRLAEVYSSLGETAYALEKFNEVIRQYPTYPKAINARGFFHFQNGQIGEAKSDFKKLISLDSSDIVALNNLGAAEFFTGNFFEAVEAWRESYRISPNSANLSNVALASFYIQDYETAVDMYLRAVELNDEDYLLWGNLADAQWLAQREAVSQTSYARASELLDAFITVNPDSNHAKSISAYYAAKLGLSAKAKQTIKDLPRDQLQDPQDAYDLALTSAILRDKVEILYWLKKAMDLGYPLYLVESDPRWPLLLEESGLKIILRQINESESL